MATNYAPDWVDRWREDTRLAVLTGDPPVQHIVRVTYTHPSFTGERPLLFEDGTVTLDADAVGFCEVNLTTQVPATTAELATLDPRTGTRVRVYAGYKLPGKAEDVHLVADVRLRERVVRRPENLATLYGVSDDATLAQSVKLPRSVLGGSGTWQVSTAGLGEALRSIIMNTVPGAQSRIDDATPAGLHPDKLAELLPAETGEPLWSLLSSIADLAPATVWCDALNVWRIEPTARPGGGNAVWTMQPGQNVLSSESVRSVEQGYANVAVVRRDLQGQDAPPAFDIATAIGQQHYPLVGQSAVAVSRTVRNLATEWVEPAQSMLVRSRARGALRTVEAPTAWWVAPFLAVNIGLPGDGYSDAQGPPRHDVERVTFDLGNAVMHVRAALDPYNTQTTE